MRKAVDAVGLLSKGYLGELLRQGSQVLCLLAAMPTQLAAAVPMTLTMTRVKTQILPSLPVLSQ